MFYDKNKNAQPNKELFKNPTAEYRSTPFWAWNSKLDKKELLRQIDVFKQMGFGGFHMHVRQGLETEYMSEEFLSAVRACVEKAKDENMLAWLYDEDRWPSGVAGGKVTKKLKNRQKYLCVTANDKDDCALTEEDAMNSGKPFYIATFDIELNDDGKMLGFKKTDRNEPAKHLKRHFFIVQQQGGEPRYNYQSYVDVLSKDAIDDFINITHENFKKAVGDEFGKTVPAIFTDEPQVAGNVPPQSAFATRDAVFSWTTNFAKTYAETYGHDIIPYLPYLVFDTDDITAYHIRYNYYTLVSELFCSAYMDNIGEWCDKNGIAFTGHVVGEDALYEALLNNCDIMRTYKNMHIPGIDILCDDVVFNTPIQCRSIVHQYGREAMLSELYGVTGWDFDFRGHKYQGDWQAVLGVSVRVPHLAWQTMKGEGKRDYPASISYQSAWYTQYKYLEDHYARISTAMTRGTPDVKIGIIYPIDTYKLVFASLAETSAIRTELDTHYKETAEWLLSGGFEFDYISESLLPELCSDGTNPLCVGKMEYDVIIVSDCMTLRPHTIKVLNEFKKNGGKVIVKGRTPFLSCGKIDQTAKSVCDGATIIPHSKKELLESIKDYRSVDIRNALGVPTQNLMCSTRVDGNSKWLFLAHMYKPQLPHLITEEKLSIKVKGCFVPYVYDTLSGEIYLADYKTDGKNTTIYKTLYDLDTLLLKLEPTSNASSNFSSQKKAYDEQILLNSACPYSLSEKNVLLLDMAKYSVDGGQTFEQEEIMRIDANVRKMLGLQSRRTKFVQPWAIINTPEDHEITLTYTIFSDIECKDCHLALEHPETTSITLNGKLIPHGEYGYYMDKDIKTVALPPIKIGENVLTLSMPFGLRTDLEACYLIGDFGTQCVGRTAKLIKAPEKLLFGDIVNQGFAFYGANVTYHQEFNLTNDSDLSLCISQYRGAVIGVKLDGVDVGKIAFPPFKLNFDNVKKGAHKLDVTLYGTRYNTLSALHNLNADKKRNYIGPDYWRTENEAWSYEYNFRPMGVLKTPILRVRNLT